MVKCLNHVLRGHGHKPVAKIARSDFTVRTAFELLGDISIEGFDSSTFQGHMLLIPVWQSITDEPVQNHHIALCDGSTILSPDDFVFFNEHDEGQVRKTFHMDPHNHHHHKWYYFPQQTRDEALIFTQYNSDASSQHRHTFRWVHSQSSLVLQVSLSLGVVPSRVEFFPPASILMSPSCLLTQHVTRGAASVAGCMCICMQLRVPGWCLGLWGSWACGVL